MGRGVISAEKFRAERVEIEQRTSDPSSPDANERWLRVDIKPTYDDANGNTQTGVAEFRVANSDGSVDAAPVASVGDPVGKNVIDKVRSYVDAGGSPTGTGFVPHATDAASYPNRKLEHPTDGQVAMHDALTASAIPDSGDLQARYDARQLALSDGQSVSSWADLTGNGYNLSSVDSSPTFKSSQVDGQDAVRFDSDDLRTTWTSLSESYHIFALGQLFGTAGSGNDDTIWDGATREEFRFATDTDASGDPYKLAQQSSVTGSNSDLNVHIFDTLLRPSGNNDVLNIDGTQDVTGDLGDSASDGLTLGARYNSGSTEEKSQVDIVELLFYKKDKSANASDIRDYLDRDTSVL